MRPSLQLSGAYLGLGAIVIIGLALGLAAKCGTTEGFRLLVLSGGRLVSDRGPSFVAIVPPTVVLPLLLPLRLPLVKARKHALRIVLPIYPVGNRSQGVPGAMRQLR